MKKEIWEIIFDNAVNKVDGINENSKEKLFNSIIEVALVDLPVSDTKKEPDLGSNESKLIEGFITKEISKSLQSQKGLVHNEDLYKNVVNDVMRVLSTEPWWTIKDNGK